MAQKYITLYIIIARCAERRSSGMGINIVPTTPAAVNTQENITKAQASGLAAPLQTAKAAADLAALRLSEKAASDYMVDKVGKAALEKARFYQPRVKAGMFQEPLNGSFAPPQASYKRGMNTMPSLSDIADNGIGSFRTGPAGKSSMVKPNSGCETCAQRKYQDGSDDAGVSFQSPTGVSPSMAGVAVASHEGEHVSRETDKAQKEGRVVTEAKVTFQYASCPECHKMYIAGGTTTISTMASSASSQSALDLFGLEGQEEDI